MTCPPTLGRDSAKNAAICGRDETGRWEHHRAVLSDKLSPANAGFQQDKLPSTMSLTLSFHITSESS